MDDDRLVLNYNGLYPAAYNLKLGLQRNMMTLRNLDSLKPHGNLSSVCMIDFIIIKKLPVFCFETAEPKNIARDLTTAIAMS